MTSYIRGQNFGTVGTQWFYSENAEGGCPGNCEYLHLESVLDTVIDGEITHKILQSYYRQWGDTLHLDPIYLYEQNDTVFMWSFSKSKFLITYIFNGDIGDTLTLDAPDTFSTDTTYRLVIDSIININIDGVLLKKIRTTPLDDYEFFGTGEFMERIGGLDWFFPRAAIILEAGGPIRCYSDSQIDTNFQTVACDHIIYVSVDELTNENTIHIYPNPTTSSLIIVAKHPIEKLDLFDLNGKLLESTSKMTVDFSNLANGQYILTIQLTTGQKIEKKIMKNAR